MKVMRVRINGTIETPTWDMNKVEIMLHSFIRKFEFAGEFSAIEESKYDTKSKI